MGYDEHSFGYRDLEGSKVHKALREEYGETYRQGDVIGCFIHMPAGGRRLEKSKAVSPITGVWFGHRKVLLHKCQ